MTTSQAEPLVDDDIWEEPPPPRGVRLRWVTAALLGLGLVASGFWVGAVVQRHDGATATPASGRLARLGEGGAGFRTAQGGAAGGGGGTDGTIIAVAGPTLQVSEASGSVAKVVIGPTTTVGRTGTGAPGVLQIGDTVVVRGVTGAGGTITASSVVATAQGVATTGGFGGGGGFGGA